MGFAPPVTGAVPRLVPFTKNCTEPLGSCEALAVALLWVEIVAVRTTFVPGAAATGFADTVVVVTAGVTVIVAVAGELGGLKLASPEYVAEIMCDPAESCMV